jgi:hypothetical protein
LTFERQRWNYHGSQTYIRAVLSCSATRYQQERNALVDLP